MKTKYTVAEVDVILEQLNDVSWKYESSQLPAGEYVDFMEKLEELSRTEGAIAVNSFFNNAVCLMGRYRDTPVDQGDIVSLRPEDFEKGIETLKLCPEMLVHQILPVILYSVAYTNNFGLLFDEERVILGIEGLEDSMPPPVNWDDFRTMQIGSAIQARYYHVRQCNIQRDLGNEEFGKTDFSNQPLTEGRFIGDDER